MTRNSDIPFAKSLVDYIFRWLAMEFVPGYRATNAPKRDTQAEVRDVPPPPMPPAPPKEGNGHGHRISPDAKPLDYSLSPASSPSQEEDRDEMRSSESHAPIASAPTASRLGMLVDPLSQQGTNMQTDAPACDVCGSITVRSGTCYKCLNCGNSMGCS